MNPELWQRVKNAVSTYEELSEAAKSNFLESLQLTDPDCYAEALPLIEIDEDSLGFLAKPLFHLESGLDETQGIHPGGRLGTYRLLEKLGSGGMGTVYKAVEDGTDGERWVAIKVLRRGLETEEIRHRFESERRILSFLNHPNIARLLDYGATADEQPFLVMEFIKGEHITAFCDRMRLSVRERLKIFQKICASVQYAHQNLIIHRDLKPANILVTSAGEPILLDFGIAKLLEPSRDATAVTQTLLKFRPMTPDYASPEQIKGAPTDTTCDLYSLGVVLYELLTGKRPYSLDGLSDEERLNVICNSVPERPSLVVLGKQAGKQSPLKKASQIIAQARGSEPKRLARALRGDLDMILAKALRKEPEQRYASAEQFSADIERHLQGFPLHARRDNSLYSARKFIRRHGLLVTGVLSSIIILASFSLTVARQNTRLKQQRDMAEEERERVALMSDTFQRVMELAGRRGTQEDEIIQQALNQARERFESRQLSEREKASKALALGMGYSAIDDEQAAEALLESAVDLHWRAFYREGRALPQSMLTLAQFYLKTARYPKAKQLLLEVLALLKETRGPSDWEVGRICGLLGKACDGLEQFEEAGVWFSRAKTLLEPQKKEHFSAWAEAENGFAAHLNASGQRDAAVTVYLGAIEAKEKVYGMYDFDLVQSLLPLAEIYRESHSFKAGFGILERSQQIYREAEAEKHPDYEKVLEKLVAASFDLGKPVQAESFAREGLSLVRPNSTRHVIWLVTLAETLLPQGRYMEAEAHVRAAIPLCKTLTEEDVLMVHLFLAKILRKMGDFTEAKFVLEEAAAYVPGQRGEGHASEAALLREEAEMLLANGELEQASQANAQAMKLDEMHHLSQAKVIAANYQQLSEIALAQGDFERAESAIAACLHIRQHEFGHKDHPDVMAALALKEIIEAKKTKPQLTE